MFYRPFIWIWIMVHVLSLLEFDQCCEREMWSVCVQVGAHMLVTHSADKVKADIWVCIFLKACMQVCHQDVSNGVCPIICHFYMVPVTCKGAVDLVWFWRAMGGKVRKQRLRFCESNISVLWDSLRQHGGQNERYMTESAICWYSAGLTGWGTV